jgi:hypothetical protein
MFKKEKGVSEGMRRSRKVWVQSLAMMVGGVLVGVLLMGFLGTNDELLLKVYRGIDIFGKVYKEVTLNYVDEIDPDRFVHAGIDGMLKTLDPYTVFLDERETDELDLVTTGKYAGIGVTIGLRDEAITVINLLEGFSAAKQGIPRRCSVDGSGSRGDDRSHTGGAGRIAQASRFCADQGGNPCPQCLVRRLCRQCHRIYQAGAILPNGGRRRSKRH